MGSKIRIFTDGAASGNGTKNCCGGWAYMIYVDGANTIKEYGSEKNTTNNRMELIAVIRGLDAARALYGEEVEIEVISDSSYLINCYVDGWYKNWERNGWINSARKPVANIDLWKVLIPYFNDSKIKFLKIKGHAGYEENEEVDKLAKRGAAEAKK